MARAKAEETKITTLDLPKAFFVLGKDIFQGRRFEDDFADIYREIDKLQKKIAAAKKDSAAADSDSFGQKAKALADKAQRAVTAKALSFKAQSLVRRLGKEAFERHGRDSGTAELVQVIDGHNRRADELRMEIGELHAVAEQGLRSTGKQIRRTRIRPAYLIAGGSVAALTGMCVLCGIGGMLPIAKREPAAPASSAQPRFRISDILPRPIGSEEDVKQCQRLVDDHLAWTQEIVEFTREEVGYGEMPNTHTQRMSDFFIMHEDSGYWKFYPGGVRTRLTLLSDNWAAFNLYTPQGKVMTLQFWEWRI